jgi:ketosteroid isomerase-like protein
MELFFGFLLGILASVIASFLFIYLSALIQPEQHRPIIALLRNPVLALRLVRDTNERSVKQRIETLFDAWERKDSQTYLSCWADDAVRLIGAASSQAETKDSIATKFHVSCERYSDIHVSCPVMEDIKIAPSEDVALAQVYYRFDLTRAQDSLPVVEASLEVYKLRRVKDDWLIAANIDYFSPVGPRSLSDNALPPLSNR